MTQSALARQQWLFDNATEDDDEFHEIHFADENDPEYDSDDEPDFGFEPDTFYNPFEDDVLWGPEDED